MTEHEALSRFCRTRSPARKGAFRRGFRWSRNGGDPNGNPYAKYRFEAGWGRICFDAWEEGWRVADKFTVKEEVNAG